MAAARAQIDEKEKMALTVPFAQRVKFLMPALMAHGVSTVPQARRA